MSTEVGNDQEDRDAIPVKCRSAAQAGPSPLSSALELSEVAQRLGVASAWFATEDLQRLAEIANQSAASMWGHPGLREEITAQVAASPDLWSLGDLALEQVAPDLRSLTAALFEGNSAIREFLETLTRAGPAGSRVTQMVSAITDIAGRAAEFSRLSADSNLAWSVGEALSGLDLAAQRIPSTTAPDVLRFEAASQATYGVLRGAELLDAPQENAPVERDDPHLEGRERLRAALSRVDPALLRKLDGALHALAVPGPDTTSQAANSLVECIDWTLRTLAANDRVLEWHHDEGGAPADLDADGKPTRALRVRFVARDHPDTRAVAYWADALVKQVGLLQKYKHGMGVSGRSEAVVESMAMSVEGSLAFLLLSSD